MKGEVKLTERQCRALRWIDETPHHHAAWMKGKRLASGPRETWDAFVLSGREGSIRIAVQDWEVISPLVRASDDDARMYEPTPAGRTALGLAQAQEGGTDE